MAQKRHGVSPGAGLASKRRCSAGQHDSVESLDVEARGENAYIRFMGDGMMLLSMWFTDELSSFRKMSAKDEAMQFANAYGA